MICKTEDSALRIFLHMLPFVNRIPVLIEIRHTFPMTRAVVSWVGRIVRTRLSRWGFFMPRVSGFRHLCMCGEEAVIWHANHGDACGSREDDQGEQDP